jgi:serine/threonine protein phosphatase PrpC
MPVALSAGMRIEHAAVSFVGRRQNNEDSFLAEPSHGLFVVADGMGGYEGGEVASRLAVDTLADFYAREAEDGERTWPFGLDKARTLDENRLGCAVRLAHAEVRARRQDRLAMMGTTVVALQLAGRRAVVAHVGDSRLYRLRGGSIEQLTRDHSLYAELVAAGGNPGPKAESGIGNIVTRALGMDGDVRADTGVVELAVGDVFLLCSDGVTETLDDARLAELLSLPSAQVACSAVVDEAFARGGRDNITAVVVRVVS